MGDMRILAIETSCDETGIAIIAASGGLKNPEFKILKNLVSSQIKIHRPFGGVVPNLAKREHLKNLPILYRKIFGAESGKLKVESCDLITVTVGPGLEPALWTGINFAKELAVRYKKTIVGANHLEGHLYSFLLPQKTVPLKAKGKKIKVFPAVALIVSGGHTIILKMDSFSKWKRLGETRDDAAGEAFDKVARLLDLPYPGGPEIEKIAREGRADAVPFPRPMMHDKNYDFSFSGLKTAVLYYLRDNTNAAKADVAASFQQAAVDVLVSKTIRAAKQFGAQSILLSGGVASNKLLRGTLKKESEKNGCSFFVSDFKYNQDNAAMIAIAGYMAYCRKKNYKLAAKGDLDI
jgi:N6-L-threonylcarbamoyladenine synthase